MIYRSYFSIPYRESVSKRDEGKRKRKAKESEGELDDTLLEEGVREILAEHGGEAREAIRSLLRTVSYLEKATGS